ncbi:uncharacterized protein LOC133284184 [Gastrolobium bilobum]|uniref:uncharacterized protein LOC133284184 n=1 Tax=Gastrolobium bilobum TaxID=150636 RepID=UPI002AAFFC80|nr:uncharacterized protein LOC133284184 [Gastrolobium bilobum]
MDYVVILEPRVSGVKAARIIKSMGFSNHYIEEAFGFSGGLWLLWNHEKLSLDVVDSSYKHIHCKVELPEQVPFLFTAVYANPRIEKRKELCDKFRLISQLHSDPWLIAGDFNEISLSEEKRGGAPVDTSRIASFVEVLNNCSMIDLGSSGPFFTWRGPKFLHLDRVFKRLDRACANG